MNRRAAIKSLATLPALSLTLSAAETRDLPTLEFDAEGQIQNLEAVFRSTSWQKLQVRNLARREALAVLPRNLALVVKDEPPTFRDGELIPAPKQVYCGVVRVRQLRYIKLPNAKLTNPIAPRIFRTPASTLAPADAS